MQKNQVELIPYAIYKKWLKMNCRVKHKSLKYKTFGRKWGNYDTEFANNFFYMTPKTQATKEKIN